MHGHDLRRRLTAILTALAGELEVVQPVAGDLNMTETNSAAIGALLTSIDALLTTMDVDTGAMAALLATIDADTGAIKTAVELLDDTLGTHDAADSGPSTKIGGVATALNRPSVGEGDRVDASFDKEGYLRVRELRSSSMSQSLGLLDDVVLAHDAADASSKSVKTGHRAVAIGATPANVAAEDRTDSIANRDGVPWVATGHPNTLRLHEKFTVADEDEVIDAGGSVAAGQAFVLTSYAILLDGDCSEDAVAVTLKIGSLEVVEHPGIKPGSGVVESGGHAPIAIGANGADVTFTCEAPTDGALTVQVSGYLLDIA
jgi:hypothetical protein